MEDAGKKIKTKKIGLYCDWEKGDYKQLNEKIRLMKENKPNKENNTR